MNKIFERVIITFSMLLVLASSVGLYITANAPLESSSAVDREVVGQISSVENNVKRKVFGNFSWDIMDQGEPVYFKDVIFVSPQSNMKLTLADKTELLVGENTLLVLDNKLLSKEGNRFEVTELRLIRGSVSVKQAEGAASKPMQLVLNNNIKFDLKKDASLSLSKLNGKASVIFDKGNVAMAGQAVTYTKPTLVNDIDLSADDAPELSTLSTQEVASIKDLPVIRLQDSITTQGDLSALDGQIQERKFATQSKRKVDVQINDPLVMKGLGVEPRSLAAVEENINALPTGLPTKQLKTEPEPLATPEPKKARSPIALLTPDDKLVVDFTRDIKPLTFNWDSTVPNVHFYMLEVSSDKKFHSVLTRIAVDGTEGRTVRDEEGRKKVYDLKVSPLYMLYVPGLLGSVYKSKELYWRVVPLDSDNTPLIRSSMLEARKIGFRVSKAAEIYTRDTNFYNKETAFSLDPVVTFQWTFKNIVPGSYQLVISEDPDFKTQICTKEISKYNFKKGVSLKTQPDMAGKSSKVELNFTEDIKVNARTECALEPLMKAQKSFYYKIISFDPADQKVPYGIGRSPAGKFQFK